MNHRKMCAIIRSTSLSFIPSFRLPWTTNFFVCTMQWSSCFLSIFRKGNLVCQASTHASQKLVSFKFFPLFFIPSTKFKSFFVLVIPRWPNLSCQAVTNNFLYYKKKILSFFFYFNYFFSSQRNFFSFHCMILSWWIILDPALADSKFALRSETYNSFFSFCFHRLVTLCLQEVWSTRDTKYSCIFRNISNTAKVYDKYLVFEDSFSKFSFSFERNNTF